MQQLLHDVTPTVNHSVKGIIKIFYYCNSYCVFCHSEDNKIYKADLTKAKNKIDLAIETGIDQILFSGGEPTIYPGFRELVEYAVSKELFTGIISNGRTLSNEELVFFLLENKANYFYLSLHGYNAQLNDEITESEGSWQEAIDGFKNLIRISNQLNIKIDFPYKELKITILNLNGQKILTATNQTELDISQFPKGLYFIKLTIDNEKIDKSLMKTE